MPRKKKKEPLVVGQTVWIEVNNMFNDIREDRKLRKMKVHEANRSSAYIWYDEDDVDKDTKTRYRVNQKTHEISGILFGYSYRLWLSKEDYEAHREFVKKKTETRKFVRDYVSSPERTYSELLAIKEFITNEKAEAK